MTLAPMRTRFTKKVHFFLRLMRIPNIFTAMADILAGYLIIAGPHIQESRLLLLLLSSSCIYAAGCVLNDLCDWRTDAKERPFRPLPSGRVSLNEAFLLAVLLFSLGLASAYAAGEHSFIITVLLALLVIIYDAAVKGKKVVGPLTMGACRAMNLILGMSPGLAFSGFPIIFPMVSLIYVFALTCLSAFEVTGRAGEKGWVFLAGWLFVILSLIALHYGGILSADSLLFLVIYGLFTAPGLLKGAFDPAPAAVGRAVKTLILGIPLIDAVYVSGVQGWTYGIPVALCIVPAILLSRHFAMT